MTWTVFLAGILSFFSPCTWPLLPFYLSVLAGGDIHSRNKKNLITNSIGFILGFSLIFTLLGLSATALGQFLLANRIILSKIASFFVIFFGLFLAGGFEIPLLMKEKRLHPRIRKITPLSAFIMGSSFSLGWTPCLGPVLTSVLLMAGSTQDFKTGAMLLLVFSAGHALPFFLLALAAEKITGLMPVVRRFLPLFQKAAGVILILMGIMLFFVENTNPKPETKPYEGYPAPDFELKDLSGKRVRLSDFRGKTVVLNFWSLNCSYCLAEMPDFEEFYRSKPDSVEVLMVNLDRNAVKVETYIKNKGYTFPVLMDESSETIRSYLIRGVPITLVVGEDGIIRARVEGQVNKEILDSLVGSACDSQTPP
ncbi:MAG: redoxin domain-containing protein [Thermosediminibacteraceae bacterium]|nr:redoxin domain-containing protein [Thermosediminibacteraceae bacterium]